MHRWTDKMPKNHRKCWELSAQSVQLPRKGWLFRATLQFFKEIAILWRNSSIWNDESRTTKFSLLTGEQRNREISNVVDEKSRKTDKNKTVVQQKFNISWRHTFFLIRINFFVSPIHGWLSSLTVSLLIQIENWGRVDTCLDHAKRLLEIRRVQWRFRGTRTIPLCPRELRDWSLLSWHQHLERMPSGAVFSTEPREIQQD